MWMATRTTAWAGIDIGKTHHWICAVDTDGRALGSVKVANIEADLVAVLATVTDLADQVVWAVDIVGAPSALILALLARAGNPVFYASGRVVNTMSAGYTGEGKTDAKDAYVIAETLRLRRDLPVVDTVTDLTRELVLLAAHRSDLIADRVRMINRLRDVMTSVFPTLEQQFDYSSHKGALILLTEYASPKRLRRLGEARLTQWLRRRQVRDAAAVAARALAAARGQDIELSGQQAAEMIIAELGWTFGDVDHVRDPILALPDLPRRPPYRTTSPQTPGQFVFQGAARLHIQRLVDGFGAHLHLQLIGKLDLQSARDLLRGVLLGQVRLHLPTQLQALDQPGWLRAGGAVVGQSMRGAGPIPPQSIGIAAQLP